MNVKDLSFESGGHQIFKDVNFSVNNHDKIGLVGTNGVGKTALLNMIAGNLEPTSGDINKADIDIGLLPQDLRKWVDTSVYSFIEEVTGTKQAREFFEDSCLKLEKSTDKKSLLIYSDALEKYTRFDVGNFDHNLDSSLRTAGIPDIDVQKELGNFSGGQKTRIALAALIAAKYDIMLLDEPTNNLDEEGVVVLEKFIGSSNAAFVIVSHDRRFLRNATSRIIELIGGEEGVKQYGLGYDEYVEARASARTSEQKRYEDNEKARKSLQKSAKEAQVRANNGSSGASKKADNDKLTANFRSEKAASRLSRAAQGMMSRIEQMESIRPPAEEISLAFEFKHENAKHSSILSAKDLTAKYEENDEVFGPLDLNMKLGDRVLISGPNGVGKTSIIKTITGINPVHTGEVNIPAQDSFVYIDQMQTLPLSNKSAYDNIKNLAPHLEDHEAINLLIKFNINKDKIQTTPASLLSGGERAKVLLSSIVAKKADLLIMDEPTNNLDIPTIEALEQAIDTYKGGLILVSHDRDFVEKIKINKEIKLRKKHN